MSSTNPNAVFESEDDSSSDSEDDILAATPTRQESFGVHVCIIPSF